MPAPPAPQPQANVVVVLATLLAAGLAFALLQTMVSPALPAIAEEFDTTPATAAWTLTGFLLAASVATPIIGKLGDLYGKGRMLVLVLIAFGTGSLIAASTDSIEVLIGARLLQGVAGGVFPLSFGIIRDTFPPAKVAVGIGALSATFGIGGGLGLPLAGVIVDNASLSVLFLVGTLAFPAAVAAWRFIPPSPTRPHARVDWAGAALLSAGLVSLLLGLSKANDWGWGSLRVDGLIAGGLALLVAFVAFELRHAEPLVDIRVLRRRAVLFPNLTGMLIGFAMFSSFLLVPLFVQAPEELGYGFSASVTEAGLFLAPSAFVMLFAGPLAGALGARYGSRLPLAFGTVAAAASFGVLTVAHTEAWHIVLSSSLLGLGIAFSLASMANLVVEAVDQRDVGIATGINTIMRTIGGALGAQVAVAIVTADSLPSGVPAEGGYTAAFALSAGMALLALLATLAIPATRAGRAASAARPAPVEA